MINLILLLPFFYYLLFFKTNFYFPFQKIFITTQNIKINSLDTYILNEISSKKSVKKNLNNKQNKIEITFFYKDKKFTKYLSHGTKNLVLNLEDKEYSIPLSFLRNVSKNESVKVYLYIKNGKISKSVHIEKKTKKTIKHFNENINNDLPIFR